LHEGLNQRSLLLVSGALQTVPGDNQSARSEAKPHHRPAGRVGALRQARGYEQFTRASAKTGVSELDPPKHRPRGRLVAPMRSPEVSAFAPLVGVERTSVNGSE